MPDVEVQIGGRGFTVSCQEGEEQYLMAAAAMLDAEAQTLADQLGRMTGERMLLMAGLMLADKTAGLDEDLRRYEAAYGEAQEKIAALEARPAPEPETVEVPMVPPSVVEAMAEFAAQAEALAAEIEARATPKTDD